jgi:hypothetical protein
MSKKARDFLFFAFVAIFIIMTILISLYASGYKFNLSWPLKFNRLLQKTGMLNVSTTPKNATIYLDGKQQRKSVLNIFKKDLITTPAKIKNILPGEYILRLERENYWPFERKIKIDSGQTTFAEDINLFLSDLPLLIKQDATGSPLLNDNGRYIYISSEGKIINLKDNSESPLQTKKNANGHWLKNSNKFFVDGKILDIEKNTAIDLTILIGNTNATWQYSNFDNLIYYSDQKSINRLASDNRTISTLIKGEEYLTFEPRNEILFAVVQSGNQIALKSYFANSGEKSGQIDLPPVGDYVFKQENTRYVCLYDQKNFTLYLINPADMNDYSVVRGIKSWSWINNEEIIYNNDWEINIFNIQNGRSTLITRVSENIKNVLWHKDGGYYIFSTDNKINAADMQTGTVTTILNSENIATPILDENNNLLYFYAKIGQRSGIYKMLLQ